MLLCSIGCNAPAATIHRWIDADGLTHFSDAPPSAAVDGATTIEIDDTYPLLPDTKADYYSIANQWNRMREERDAKNKLTLEEARIRTEQSAALAYSQPMSEQPSYRGGYPIYGLPHHRPNQHGAGLSNERHSAFRRGPHHVQAGHGQLRSRAQSRSRSAGSHGGQRNARHGGAGFRFGFSLD